MIKLERGLEELKIGEMPQPRYIQTRSDTEIEGRDIKWIGMRAYAPDKTIKDFIWWSNFNIEGNLRNERTRYKAASYIARLKLDHGAEIALGLPIDLVGSNQSRNHVAIVEQHYIYGFYVEADRRPMFNLVVSIKGCNSEQKLRRFKPTEFERTLQQAREVLPYDEK